MALFAVFGTDASNGLALRDAHRPAHRAYVSADVSHLRLAGALVDDALGEGVAGQCGTLYLIEAEDEAAVRAWAVAEPFVAAGVYASLTIRRITVNAPWSLPAPLAPDALARMLAGA